MEAITFLTNHPFYIYLIFGILTIILIVVGWLAITESNKAWNEREDLYNRIGKAETVEEWINLKKELIELKKKQLKKKYVEQETTGSLYGALAEKAEELFNKKSLL